MDNRRVKQSSEGTFDMLASEVGSRKVFEVVDKRAAGNLGVDNWALDNWGVGN